MVWETMGLLHGKLYSEISVVFEDVNFVRATHVPKEGVIQLAVMIQKGYLVSIQYKTCAIMINNQFHYMPSFDLCVWEGRGGFVGEVNSNF